MDNQYTYPLLHRHRRDLNSHRSTGDLLPKSRPQALRARHAAARSKLNLIARQLYDLKYDHEWQQQQLQNLVNRGDSLEKQVDAGIKRVKEVEVIATIIEEMDLPLASVGKEGGLGSERSTQPEQEEAERQAEMRNGGEKEVEKESICQTGIQSNNAEHFSQPEIMTSSITIQSMKQSSKMKPRPSLKPQTISSSKKIAPIQTITSIPMGNIVLFTFLLFIVLALL